MAKLSAFTNVLTSPQAGDLLYIVRSGVSYQISVTNFVGGADDINTDLVTLAGVQTLTNKTLTTPKIVNAGYISDESGNEQINFTTTASAVNNIGVKNNTTGNNPVLFAAGEADTGISFQNSEGENMFVMDAVPSGVGCIGVQNAAAGNKPQLYTAGANDLGLKIITIESEEMLILVPTASAVNEITITSAATGNAPQIAATGGDTNIDLLLKGKGSGSPRFSGNHDGWIDANETPTYASASTMNVLTGATSKFQKGDRIRFKQGGGWKYAVLTTTADTLLTILVNTDYTIANAAITDFYYSHEVNPIGYPHWFNCAAPTFIVGTIDNGSGGQPTTTYYRQSIIGNTLFVRCSGSGTKATTDNIIAFTLPVYEADNAGQFTSIGIIIIIFTSTRIVGTGGNIDSNPALCYLFLNTNITDNQAIDFGFNLAYEF